MTTPPAAASAITKPRGGPLVDASRAPENFFLLWAMRENLRPCREASSVHSCLLCRAIDDLANYRLQRASGVRLIMLADLRNKMIHVWPLDQIDGRAAKTAAGQPRAETGRMLAGQLDEQIQFGRTVLKKVARAF